MHRGRVALFAVATLLVLSGCTLPASPDRFDTERELGHIGDYAHDDAFEFDGSEGLTERELEAVKYRSMARIEVVRGLKFEHDVGVEVISRAEYREQRGVRGPASPFTNELWRGAFVVDRETDVNRAFDDLYGDAVQGYYSSDRIVVVGDDANDLRIDRRTLVHELVHALQDQHFGLARTGETIDERRAEQGVLEGEANYVPYLYDRRCGEEWQCLPDPERAPSEVAERPFNVGLFLSIYAPYSEGPPFVAHLHETGGWERVDRAHDERPTSTSQLLHPERYPDVEPVAVEIADRSSQEWEPIARNGEPRTETVGEATLFGALWVNGAVDRPIGEGGTELSPYNYTDPATEGWAGDSIQVYRAVDDRERTGHVWRLAWETEADAEAFAAAYRDLLEGNGAEPVTSASDEADVYRIPDGEPFGGAYRVAVGGETVELVGGPSVDAVEGIRPAESAPLAAAGAGESSPAIPTTPIAPAATAAAQSAPAAPADG